ncbi:hypothetical protein [Yoonia sp. MH D7]
MIEILIAQDAPVLVAFAQSAAGSPFGTVGANIFIRGWHSSWPFRIYFADVPEFVH